MAQSVRLEPCLELTQEQIGAFLGHLTDKGCRESSVQKYRRDLTLFYTMLPEDKQIRRGTVSAWRSELVERGYAPRTINAHVAEVNGLLDFLGHRECQLPGQLAVGPEEPPELSRSEYLRLLSAARVLKRERTYLLVKLFALTGVGVQDVSLLTAEDVEAGAVPGSDDLTAAMPYRAMINIINFIQAMDQVVPGFASSETLLYSPELKFYSNRVKMDEDFNTNVRGLHCLGDSSGWTRGLMMASVMGVLMGRRLA